MRKRFAIVALAGLLAGTGLTTAPTAQADPIFDFDTVAAMYVKGEPWPVGNFALNSVGDCQKHHLQFFPWTTNVVTEQGAIFGVQLSHNSLLGTLDLCATSGDAAQLAGTVTVTEGLFHAVEGPYTQWSTTPPYVNFSVCINLDVLDGTFVQTPGAVATGDALMQIDLRMHYIAWESGLNSTGGTRRCTLQHTPPAGSTILHEREFVSRYTFPASAGEAVPGVVVEA